MNDMEETSHFAQGSSHPPLKRGSLRIYAMRFCPFAQRALLVAEAKGIQYDVVHVNLTKKPEWFLKLQPRGQVPTLEFEDGDSLAESLIVCDYLDDKYPQTPLYPQDPRAKAKDRFLIERFSEVLAPFFKIMFSFHKNATEQSVDRAAIMTTMIEKLEDFEKEIFTRGLPFFGGSSAGMLDYMMWPFFERMDVFKMLIGDDVHVFKEAGRLPNLKKWCTVMKNDDAVKKWFLTPEVHTYYLKTRFQETPDYDYLVKK